VQLMPAKYGKAYVERGKTDAGDAAAICEAVGVSVCPAAVDSSIRTDRPAALLRKPRRQTGWSPDAPEPRVRPFRPGL